MEDILFNNFKIKRFINSPVPSNTYIVVDEGSKRCVIIDPGSKDQGDLCEYLVNNELNLDYIILTHEHFDHCWGVNYILNRFDAKVVACRACAEWISIPMNYFSKLYYDSDEMYSIEKTDIIVEDAGMRLEWCGSVFKFIEAKGHTDKSICIAWNNLIFSGDTMIYKTKPWLKKKYGASIDDFKKTIDGIYSIFKLSTVVCPGHGEPFTLGEMKEFYNQYFIDTSR